MGKRFEERNSNWIDTRHEGIIRTIFCITRLTHKMLISFRTKSLILPLLICIWNLSEKFSWITWYPMTPTIFAFWSQNLSRSPNGLTFWILCNGRCGLPCYLLWQLPVSWFTCMVKLLQNLEAKKEFWWYLPYSLINHIQWPPVVLRKLF